MNAFALHHPGDRTALRWTGSALAVIAIHAGLIAAGIALYRNHAPPGVTAPAIMLDMSPVSAAPEVPSQDVAPGPDMQEMEAPSAPPPEPQAQQKVEEQIPPTPLMEKAEVTAPPEQKVEPPPTPPQEPPPVTPEKPKPTPVKPKPIRAEPKEKPKETRPSPRTSAPQRAEQVSPNASAASAGASRAAIATYFQMVQAHVQRFKQYPSGSRSGQTGTVRAMVAFTLSRSGQVLSVRSMGSSGNPAFDAEAVATVRRAQPFPTFPAEMTGGSQSFTLPLSYSLR